MIECPFCGELIDEDDLVFEFNWGDVATFFYNRGKLPEPRSALLDRSFYVTFKYSHGNPLLNTIDTTVNADRHKGDDPLKMGNGWNQLTKLLSGRKMFEVNCDKNDKSLPVSARILPIVKGMKHKRGAEADGVSTGIFCPFCEEQLKAEVLHAQTEVRIVLIGRPGSGKTVYVTQAIAELLQGRLAQSFNIEAANLAVHEHYSGNQSRLRAFGNSFVLATNPGVQQQPYVFLMTNGKSTIRLVIQDIAGEDTENRTKYSKAVAKADMLLFFIDPWHIEEIRKYHIDNNDPSNAIVERSTHGQYQDLDGIFLQMLNKVDHKSTAASGQLVGMLLVKGDYLVPPMLSQDSQPECSMMQQPISFSDPEAMEFSIGLRSSFIRQCIYEWGNTRGLARQVEGKYSAHNVRYFVTSALGQSTILRGSEHPDRVKEDDPFANPDDGFGMDDTSGTSASGSWDYDEQKLSAPPRPEHVIDPILWCLKRKGVKF